MSTRHFVLLNTFGLNVTFDSRQWFPFTKFKFFSFHKNIEHVAKWLILYEKCIENLVDQILKCPQMSHKKKCSRSTS